jgi:hypothetical protein
VQPDRVLLDLRVPEEDGGPTKGER